MDTPSEKPTMRFDASFWAVVLLVGFGLASLGCFGFAAAHADATVDPTIMTTDNCPPPPDL